MDAPLQLPDRRLQARLSAVIDPEGKIPRALEALGPIAGRRVLLLEASSQSRLARALRAGGAQLTTRRSFRLDGLRPSSFDCIVVCWRELGAVELQAAAAALAPGGRLLVIQAYGRDEVASLAAAPGHAPAAGWNERGGPRPGGGWRIRTLHCWWTFGSLEGARSFLAAAFPETGPAVAAGLRRPRLSFKVGLHHRDPDPEPADER